MILKLIDNLYSKRTYAFPILRANRRSITAGFFKEILNYQVYKFSKRSWYSSFLRRGPNVCTIFEAAKLANAPHS